MLAVYIAIMLVYMMPGMVLARGMYSEQIRAIRTAPIQEIGDYRIPKQPKKPVRPEYKVSETLHYKGCRFLEIGYTTCNCNNRKEWMRIRNAWLDYEEDKKEYDRWQREYAASKPRTKKAGTPNMIPVYAAVPLWPLVGAGMYIKGGAKNIPDYRAIERMEAEETRAIESKLKEIE